MKKIVVIGSLLVAAVLMLSGCGKHSRTYALSGGIGFMVEDAAFVDITEEMDKDQIYELLIDEINDYFGSKSIQDMDHVRWLVNELFVRSNGGDELVIVPSTNCIRLLYYDDKKQRTDWYSVGALWDSDGTAVVLYAQKGEGDEKYNVASIEELDQKLQLYYYNSCCILTNEEFQRARGDMADITQNYLDCNLTTGAFFANNQIKNAFWGIGEEALYRYYVDGEIVGFGCVGTEDLGEKRGYNIHKYDAPYEAGIIVPLD